jgi:hypothetical protein
MAQGPPFLAGLLALIGMELVGLLLVTAYRHAPGLAGQTRLPVNACDCVPAPMAQLLAAFGSLGLHMPERRVPSRQTLRPLFLIGGVKRLDAGRLLHRLLAVSGWP